ncbi:MAG TPA: hypothetical protein VKD91_13590 [Pyrinomonadaceae bacterium]|nr:hypothetical protein [Pyrinomonadaceae bacterium]
MSHVTVSLLSLLLLLAGSCGIEPVAQKGPWSLKLTTSGGFAGIGTGNLSVDSVGTIAYEAPTPPRTVPKSCQGKLDKERLASINDAVGRSNPKEWNQPGLNVAAPDAFGYKLELRIGSDSQATTVQWYDNTADKLPEDLKRLSDVLMQQMKSGCSFGNPKSAKP